MAFKYFLTGLSIFGEQYKDAIKTRGRTQLGKDKELRMTDHILGAPAQVCLP